MDTAIKQYRKKPIVIEAARLPTGGQSEDANATEAIAKWCGAEHWDFNVWDSYYIDIDTLEGTMRASGGDWVIKGIAGEFYPCKHDIFERSYEVALAPTH